MKTDDSKTFEIHDRVEKVEFTGRIIGHASSKRDHSTHWTEITFYRTDGGNYIYHSAGHSLVYHLPGQDCSRGKKVDGEYIELDDAAEPCKRCKPEPWPEDVPAKDLTFIREITLSDVHVIKNSDHLKDLMYIERSGVKHVSSLATAALNDAVTNDEEFKDFVVPNVRRID